MSVRTGRIVPSTLGAMEPKLMLPRVHPGMLRRARLLEMLDCGAGSALTIVDAAAGYGKTTLLRSWCIERPERVVWMTLDAADDVRSDCGRTGDRSRAARHRLGRWGADAPCGAGCHGRDRRR